MPPTSASAFWFVRLAAGTGTMPACLVARYALAIGDLFRQLRSMSCKVDPTRARFSEDFDVVKTAGQLPAKLAFGDYSSFDRAQPQ